MRRFRILHLCRAGCGFLPGLQLRKFEFCFSRMFTGLEWWGTITGCWTGKHEWETRVGKCQICWVKECLQQKHQNNSCVGKIYDTIKTLLPRNMNFESQDPNLLAPTVNLASLNHLRTPISALAVGYETMCKRRLCLGFRGGGRRGRSRGS
jgi:hypothetical protein